MAINRTVLDTKKLDELIAKNPTRAKRVIKESTFQVEAWYKERVPRDLQRPPKDMRRKVTGNLRNSIDSTFENSGFMGIVSDGVEYGIYQELGTSRIPARPALKPAIERLAKLWIEKWKELFDV